MRFASVFKIVFVENHSNENDFDLHENGCEGKTHFHMNDFARRLVLRQRQIVTQKWSINNFFLESPRNMSILGNQYTRNSSNIDIF